MTDPIEPISVADALALVASVPDVIAANGAKRKAVSFWSNRDGGSWQVAYQRSGIVQVNDSTLTETLPLFLFKPEDVAEVTIVLTHPDGRQFKFPAILAHALIAQTYVDLERGDIVLA